jgi:hypothetical protein
MHSISVVQLVTTHTHTHNKAGRTGMSTRCKQPNWLQFAASESSQRRNGDVSPQPAAPGAVTAHTELNGLQLHCTGCLHHSTPYASTATDPHLQRVHRRQRHKTALTPACLCPCSYLGFRWSAPTACSPSHCNAEAQPACTCCAGKVGSQLDLGRQGLLHEVRDGGITQGRIARIPGGQAGIKPAGPSIRQC